jgi:hypothetical protein
MPGGGPATSIGGSETPQQLRLKADIHLGQPGL